MTTLTPDVFRFEVTRRHSSDDRATVVFQANSRDEAVQYCEAQVEERANNLRKSLTQVHNNATAGIFGLRYFSTLTGSWFETWVIHERSEADLLGIVVHFDEATVVCNGCGDPHEFCACRDGLLYEDPR